MKFLNTMMILSALFATFTAEASKVKFAYDCSCATSKKACEGIENLYVGLTAGNLLGKVGSEDWEFGEDFEASASKLAAPKVYDQQYSRFDISKNEFLPRSFVKVNLLLEKKMLSSQQKAGTVLVIDAHGNLELSYKCQKLNPDVF